jgi:uncharacterized protein YjdB
MTSVIVVFVMVLGLFGLFGDSSQAADTTFYIEYNGGALDPSQTYEMSTSSMQLMLKTSGTAYDEDQYKVEWSIEDTDANGNVASIEQSQGNKMIAIVHALSPGNVTVTVTVKDSMQGDALLGSTTCNIHVNFAVDTAGDDSIYKYVNSSDTQRSLVLYSDSTPVQLGLNFGDASKTQWMSDNEEVVSVSQNGGLVTPKGAGHTLITATYTPDTDVSSTYTAYLDVYVIPQVSTTDGSGYSKSLQNLNLASGARIYTDTVFTNNNQPIRNKITWVVKQDDGIGNPTVIADSLGKTSDLISVTPSGMYKNELQISGVAGNYAIEFYTSGTYSGEADGQHSTAYTPTVVTFTLTANIGDKEETLSAGDSYDLAQAFGMTTEDFVKCFSSNSWEKYGGGSIANYATYNTSKATLTVKPTVSDGVLIDTVRVKTDQKAYVASLMGLDASDSDVLQNMPTTFTVKVTIKDELRLSATSITLSQGATQQLRATYNGTYDGDVKWTSSDTSYVTVDENGVVTAVKNTTGDVTVTASLTNSNGVTLTADCLVVVEPALNSFDLDPKGDDGKYNMSMFVGDSTTIKAVIKQTITNAPLSWTCSTVNSSVFTVTQATDGKSAVITATGVGVADLIVENTVSGDRKTIRITVRSYIESISLKNTELSVPMYKEGYNMGKSDVSYTPTNATDTTLIWTSSDTSVATVDEDGYITFVNAGIVLITVRPENNPSGVMASCLLTIVGSANKISLSETDITMQVGESHSILVDYSPINTTAELTWTPTGNDAASVTISYDEDRKIATINGKAPGVVYVNISSPQTGIDSIKVTVKQPATAIALSPKSLIVKTGDTAQLKATFTPANSTDTLTWSSINTGVASVDKDGVVTGVKEGTTFVRVQSYNGTVAGPTEIVQVTVQDGLKGVSLDSIAKTVKVGESIDLTPIFNPATAYDKTMTWTSSNSSIATVAASGESDAKVTGVKQGVVLITGTATDGGYTVSCLVTVEAAVKTTAETKVTVSPTTKYLAVGKTCVITATVTGSSNKKVKWSSSKKKVATVNSSGKVKAKKIGTTYIKAKAKDGSGAFARCKVRVVRKAKKLKLNKYSAKMLVGGTMKLKATIKPKNATVKSVKWTTDNKAVATVSSNGRVLALSEGMVKITATTKDGSKKKASCLIVVSEPVDATGVTVENSSIILAKGRAAQSGIVAAPANTTTSIRYYSDNPSVATVDSHGKIKSKAVGQATIYGETSNGLSGYVEVQVVDLNRKGIVMRQYDTEQLQVNDISTGVTWYSKNINIATVTSSGLVTGRKKGTTTIYAVVNGVKLGCRVKIKKIK